MKDFEILIKKKNVSKKPKVAIQGLPGIGNVGKLAVDFLIRESKARELAEIRSFFFPNTVFVNELGLVEPSCIKLFSKSLKSCDIIMISGNVQPSTDKGCHVISKNLAAYLDSINTKTLITLGGVGVSEEPKKPKVFCTANSAGILSEFKSEFPLEDAYGSIGPISGLAGLMLCDASRHNISSICLVSETVSNPFFIGLDAARELVNILTAKYDFGIDPGSFDSLFPKDSSQQPPHQADQAVQTGLDYIG